MTGKGLESLIPKKTDGGSAAFPTGTGGSSAPAAGDHLRSHPDESPSATPSSSGFRELPHGKAAEPAKRFTESIFQIEVEKIKPNPYQPRRDFNDEEIEELARSVREFGIIQPLVVTKVEKETETGTSVEYELIAGERRLMAAKKIGLRSVPAIVKRVDVGKAKLEMALVENIQRSNLNPIETARGYARLQDEFNLTHQEIASRVGKSRTAVTNTIRLLSLPSETQEALIAGKITVSEALASLAKGTPGETSHAQRVEAADPEKIYWEKRLEERFGAPVAITRRDGKGKMEIRFHSKEEWQAILDKLLGGENPES